MKESKIEDFKIRSKMKEVDRFNERCDGIMRGEEDLEELTLYNESFFTGFDPEKMEKFQTLKRLCKTVAEYNSRIGFRIVNIIDPNNRDHNGSVILNVRCPVFLIKEQYEILLEIMKYAEEIVVTVEVDKKNRKILLRVSFCVMGIFYDENRR